MDFRLTEEQQALQNAVSAFVDEHYQPQARREIAFNDQGYDQQHWKMMLDNGWLKWNFSENGDSRSLLNFCLVLQQLGKALFPAPIIDSICVAGGLLQEADSDGQHRSVLAALLSGDQLIVPALWESDSRWQYKIISSTANLQNGRFTLNGRKSMVNSASLADAYVVVARTSGKPGDEIGLSLFLVDAKAEGVICHSFRTQTGAFAAQLEFENVKLNERALIGSLDGALPSLNKVFNEAAIALSAYGIGAMQSAVDWTIEHLKSRKQFDTPLSEFQSLQHRIVDMFTLGQEAESLLYLTALRVHADDDAARMSSAIKSRVGRSGRMVGENMIQLHGGWGMRDDHLAGQYLKALMAVDAQFGNADFHTSRFSRT